MTEGELAEYVRMTREGSEVVGLIVTTPLKQPILAHLDEATDLVRLVGASNCVRFDDNGWRGANFDGLGFIEGLAAAAGRSSEQRILLVGCGGAGGAIAASLVMTGKVDLALYDIEEAKAGPPRCAARRRVGVGRANSSRGAGWRIRRRDQRLARRHASERSAAAASRNSGSRDDRRGHRRSGRHVAETACEVAGQSPCHGGGHGPRPGPAVASLPVVARRF